MFHRKTLFQANHFVPLIEFYSQSKKQKRVSQHLQFVSSKSKIDVKSMISGKFFRKSSVSFKQPVGENIVSFFTKMSHAKGSKQSYGFTCSHTTQQIVTRNPNAIS